MSSAKWASKFFVLDDDMVTALKSPKSGDKD
jgi:hypothetical protein